MKMIAPDIVAATSLADEVVLGLGAPQKSLPPKLFYDAAGSALFEEITRLPEYYLTRTEFGILERNATRIVSAAGPGIALVELGAGTAAKTTTLLAALQRRQMLIHYVPVDISPAALDEARHRVASSCLGVRVQPRVADLGDGFAFLSDVPGRRMVAYLGSSIGNFEPNDAIQLLRDLYGQLGPGDTLLLGTDMAKDPAILLPAYDDDQGVTSEFNKNILRRINREFSANFDPEGFRHVACWNPVESRIEMYLESLCEQAFRYGHPPLAANFRFGERIHTENSYKYTESMVAAMLDASGFHLEHSWYDPQHWFGLHLARV